ncbi:MAG: hypothetical protein NWQ78_04195, partial [Pontimonas sp.]|nr:hypothetical protein [Pontimonas sp.]
MTDTPSVQPMTRRERRQLEEQGLLPAAPATQSAEQAAPPTPAPVQSASPEQEPVPSPSPPSPPAPMSRRERKMLE